MERSTTLTAAADRFWSKVDRSSAPGGCWQWTAATNGKGYGVFWLNGRREYAHRVAWMLLNGPIPAGLGVLHRCDNPLCCNMTAHGFVGDQAANNLDRDRKGRHRSRGNGFLPAVRHLAAGELRRNAKATPAVVIAMRAAHRSGVRVATLARLHNISHSQTTRIVSGRSWKYAEARQ